MRLTLAQSSENLSQWSNKKEVIRTKMKVTRMLPKEVMTMLMPTPMETKRHATQKCMTTAMKMSTETKMLTMIKTSMTKTATHAGLIAKIID